MPRIRKETGRSVGQDSLVQSNGVPMDPYTFKLNRSFILRETLNICLKEPRSDVYDFAPDSTLEVLAIEELERWLLNGKTFLTSRQIHQRGGHTLGAAIARRMVIQISMNDASLPEAMNYWIDLTKVRVRSFRSATTMILFTAIHEATKLLVTLGDTEYGSGLLELIRKVWLNGLLRADADVDIYLRAFALRLTSCCCQVAPTEFWDAKSAILIVRGACDRTKTVRMEALTQMIELSHNHEINFEDSGLATLWIDVLALHAAKPSRSAREVSSSSLTGLVAMLDHAPQVNIDQDIARSLLTWYVQTREPITTVAMAIRFLWRDFGNRAFFDEIITIFVEHGRNNLHALGEALSIVNAKRSAEHFVSYIMESAIDDGTQAPWLRIMFGLAEALDDRQILDLATAFCTAHSDVTFMHFYVLKLLQHVKNQCQDEFQFTILSLRPSQASESLGKELS